MEKNMMKKENVKFKGIFCGKIRRYFSWENFLDLLKVPVGIIQSFFIVIRFRPKVVFCKGGYVSFPIALGAFLARVPVILHESDLVPGLANRLSARFATKICVSYEESKKFFSKNKVVLTGNPVRKDIVTGRIEKGREITGFNSDLPVLLFMGGSQGAESVNRFIFDNLKDLLSAYQIVHICGSGNVRHKNDLNHLVGPDYESLLKRYIGYEFVGEELKHFYALCDVVISRAGAMSLAEIAAIKRPALLIPLGTEASRGDQIDNAKAFAKDNNADVINEVDLTKSLFLEKLEAVMKEPDKNSAKSAVDATEKIISLFKEL